MRVHVHREARRNRTWLALAAILAIALVSAAPAAAAPAAAPHGAMPAMEKFVSPQGDFVVYRPTGWAVDQERLAHGAWRIVVTGPKGYLEASLAAGAPAPGGAFAALATVLGPLRQHARDVALHGVRTSRDGQRAVANYAWTDAARGRREGRCWASATANGWSVRRCEAPAGKLGEYQSVLLTILANVRILRGGFAAAGSGSPARAQPLVTHRLPDGSATFGVPADWQCTDLRAGQFIARHPSDGAAFLVGAVDVITPRMGVRPPGVPVSPYLEPERAWPFVTRAFMHDIRYLDVRPRPDLDAAIGRAYTAGPVRCAELYYTYRSLKGELGRGYTFGISYGSRLNTNWKYWHISVAAPDRAFASYAPTLAAMAASYRIDDAYARNYIAAGMQRLHELEAETRSTVTRNAEEIHATMQAAYDERQKSQDYLDYQRTNWIRGEQDWVTGVEGGTVFHTDAWGTKNTYTGQSWEGAPFDYYHYTGTTTGGDLIPVDDRATYEKVFGK